MTARIPSPTILVTALLVLAGACSTSSTSDGTGAAEISGRAPSAAAPSGTPEDLDTNRGTGGDTPADADPDAAGPIESDAPVATALPVGIASMNDVLAAGSGGEVDGDVAVSVGGGELVLRDADLDVAIGDGGELVPQSLGTATLELPNTGPLAGASLDRPVRGRVGIATGADLADLGAHLRPEQLYLYADLGNQGFELSLGLDDAQGGTDGLPARISTGGGSGASMFVADLDGDYFYLSTPCAAMLPTGDRRAAGGDAVRTDTRTGARDADDSPIPGASADLSSFDPGGCGIGWSSGGLVPFTPLLTGRLVDIPTDFGSHLVIDGTVPVAPGISLDGELFYRFDADGVSVWANGELDLGLSFLKGSAEVTLPAARGTFGLEMTQRTLDLWVTATAGSSAADGTSAALLADLAPIRGQVDLDGELHVADGEVLASSFLQLSGNVSIAPTPIRTNSDVEVRDVFAADALVRIDSSGIVARGSVQASPIGAIAITGAASAEFKVPFADPADSYLHLTGSLGIGDTDLGATAELRLDRNGALARGTVDLAGFGGLGVEGWLGPDGFQLTGTLEATLPIGDLDQVAATLVDQTANDEVIRSLNREIDERVAAIASRDAAKGTELRNTVADMRTAFADIASVRDTIAYNDGLIAGLWQKHQADIDWHWALNDFDRFWDKGPHAVRLGAILVEIEALKLANSVQYGYIDVANLVVSTAQQIALGVVGWDDELNALLALQTEAYLGTLAGNVVSTILNGADAVLDAFGVDGSATGTVTVTVGTQGIGATADLAWCRDGSCTPLAGATVTLSPAVEVCASFVGIPACVRL